MKVYGIKEIINVNYCISITIHNMEKSGFCHKRNVNLVRLRLTKCRSTKEAHSLAPHGEATWGQQLLPLGDLAWLLQTWVQVEALVIE